MDLNSLLTGVTTVAGVTVPNWALAAGGVVVLLLLFRLMRPRAATTGAAPSGVGTLALLALVAVAAGAAYFGLKQYEDSSRFAERRALEDRIASLLAQTNQPGSVLGCLNAALTPVLDEACEKQIFAEPQRLASAVGITAERIVLLTDATNFAQREPAFLDRFEHLRKSLEADPYGLVAHVLAVEHKCIPDSCTRFRLLKDTDKIKGNLTARKFDGLLAKYSPAWAPPPPVAAPTTPPVSNNDTKDEKDTPPSNQTSNAQEQPSSTPVALPQTAPAPTPSPVNTAKQKAPQKQKQTPPPQAKRKGPPEPVGGLPRVTARGNQNQAEEEEDDTPAAAPQPQPPQTPSIFQRR
jgi:hypothetical protein